MHAVADEPFKPIVMITKNPGTPRELVVEYKLNPELLTRMRRIPTFVRNATLRQLTDEEVQRDQAAVEKAANDEGWANFNLGFGGTGAVGTIGENVLQMGGLKNINSAMTDLGLFMTFWQVSLDLSAGRDDAAGINAYKGLMGFAIGKFGTSALQVANITVFFLDVAMQSFGTGAWLARTDAWRIVYTKYYSEMNTEAEKAKYGPQPRPGPTYAETLARIRGQTEGGRSFEDWEFLLYHYYRNARSPDEFKERVMKELALYTAKFWDSPQMDTYVAIDASSVGVAPGASLTQAIRNSLEDEYKARLLARFAKDVFPRIAFRAWRGELEKRVVEFNRDHKPTLNQTIVIEIGAYHLEEKARLTIPKPAGGQWTGFLQPDKPRPLAITKLAMLRAGMPHEITLELPGGPVTRPFILIDDHATVSFGEPVTPLVVAYDRQETGLSCTIRTTPAHGKPTTRQVSRAAPAGDLHFAMSGTGSAVLGRFEAASNSWSSASPGAVGGGGAIMLFSAPRYEDIYGLSGCSGGFLAFDSIAAASCKLERRSFSTAADGTRTDTTCTSQVRLTLKGAFMAMGETTEYFPLDGERGAIIRNVLRQAMGQMQGVRP